MTVVSIADTTSGPASRARARWFKDSLRAAPKRWRAMSNEEALLAMLLTSFPHPKTGFVAHMAQRAMKNRYITEKQAAGIVAAGLHHKVIKMRGDRWAFTQEISAGITQTADLIRGGEIGNVLRL
jgi:hypothetical protein